MNLYNLFSADGHACETIWRVSHKSEWEGNVKTGENIRWQWKNIKVKSLDSNVDQRISLLIVHISQRWVYQLCEELGGSEGVPGEDRPGEQLEARPGAGRRPGAEHGQGERRLQSHRQGQQRLRGQGGVPPVYQVIWKTCLRYKFVEIHFTAIYPNISKKNCLRK